MNNFEKTLLSILEKQQLNLNHNTINIDDNINRNSKPIFKFK